MSTIALAAALRAKAARMKQAADIRVDQTGRVDPEEEDSIELVRVLARLVEGKTFKQAFGAPGDWSGEIEAALRAA